SRSFHPVYVARCDDVLKSEGRRSRKFSFSQRITYQGGKMPSVVRSTFVLGAFVFAAVTATACGDKVNVTGPAKDSRVQSVLVSPPGPVPMKIGDKVTFAASVTGGPDLTNKAVTWKSSATNIATVDNNGVVTAVSGGTASIIATSVANTTVSGAAVVT